MILARNVQTSLCFSICIIISLQKNSRQRRFIGGTLRVLTKPYTKTISAVPCLETPSRYAVLRPNVRVGDIISTLPMRSSETPSDLTYKLQENSIESYFAIDEIRGSIFIAKPIPIPVLLVPHRLNIFVTSKNKGAASAPKQERSFQSSTSASIKPNHSESDREIFSPELRESPPNFSYNDASNMAGFPTGDPPQSSPYNIFTVFSPTLTPLSIAVEANSISHSPFVPFPAGSEVLLNRQVFPATEGTPPPVASNNDLVPQYPVLPNFGGYPVVPNSPLIDASSGSNATLARLPPVCSQPFYTGIVSENAPIGTFVVRVAATGDRVQWSLADTAFERFMVNPGTGEVSVSGSLKRRTRAAMEFKLRAIDAYGLWCDTMVRINVVADSPTSASNYPPSFAQNYYFLTVPCGTNNHDIGMISASDVDSGQTLTYHVLNTNEFTIGANGNIQNTVPLLTSNPRTFSVVAIDNGYPPLTATTTISVSVMGTCAPQPLAGSNTPPNFGQSNYVLSASCRVNGVFVGMITATDYEGNGITYSLNGFRSVPDNREIPNRLCKETEEIHNRRFQWSVEFQWEFVINPATGELRAQGALSDSSPRVIYVTATDNGTPPMSSAVPVTVNVINCNPLNNPPIFAQSSYQYTVACGSAAGTNIGISQAYDTEGNQITYALTGPQGITISPATGVITLTSSVQSLGLRQYTVQATDNGQPQMSSSVPVTVIVNGDCVSAVSPVTAYSAPTTTTLVTSPMPTPPFFPQTSYSVNAPCLSALGSLVGVFPAVYSAGQQYLNYFLTGTSEFYTNNLSEVRNTVAVPGDTTRIFQIVVSDNRYPFLTATAQITVKTSGCPILSTPAPAPVYPSAEQIPLPFFPQSSYPEYVSCLGSPGSVIGTIAAQYQMPEQLKYTVAGTSAFTVDNSGRLINTVPLDGALVPNYFFIISATDVRNPSTLATATVNVNVLPCEIPTTTFQLQTTTPILVSPPFFSRTSYTANISCITVPGFLVGTITAQYTQQQALRYTLANTNAFSVDNFGQITSSVPVDGLTIPVHNFAIVAADRFNPSVQSMAQVTVNVAPCVSTQKPSVPFMPRPPLQFSQSSYVFNVQCQTTPGVPIGLLSIVPSQQGQQVVYSVTDSNVFTITNSGQLSSTVPLKGDQTQTYTLTVVARAVGVTVYTSPCIPSISATSQPLISTSRPLYQTLTPSTTPATPAPPQFQQSQYFFTVSCLNTAGNLIGTAAVQYSQSQRLVYTILRTNSFFVNNFGQIMNSVPLIADVTPLYTFILAASDPNYPSQLAEAQVTVNVLACPTTLTPATTPSATTASTPPFFLQQTYSANVSCLTTSGFLIGTIPAQYSRPLIYSLASTNAFSVDNFGQIINTVPLDGSRIPFYSFSIVAQGTNGALTRSNVSVFISACPSNVLTLPQPQPTPFTFPTAPSVVFTPTSPGILSSTVPPQFLLPLYKANVSCQDRPGFLVGTITAQYAEPQFLSYSLVGTSAFRVDNFGQITNSILLNGAIIPSYTFTIVAADQRNSVLRGSALVMVTVAPCLVPTTTLPSLPDLPDTDERPPVFTLAYYSFVVPCSISPGTQAGTVRANDWNGNAVSYRIVSGTSEFTIDSARGSLVLTRPFDASGSRTIIVAANGSGKIPLSATATVQILITEPCEQPTQLPYPTTTYPQIFTKPPLSAPPPRFNQGLYLFTYRCASGDSVIGSVQATGSGITYTIQGTNTFTVSSGGEIRAIGNLQGPQTVAFQVVASEATGSARTDVTRVQVSVPACSTAATVPPFFPQSQYSFSIACPSSSNILVGTATAKYAEPQNLVYQLSNTNVFSVDNLGEIRSTVFLVSGSTHIFSVTATDGRDLSLVASAQVAVNVLPCATPSSNSATGVTQLGLQPPRFGQATYSFLASCPLVANQFIGNVQAYSSGGSSIRYQLSGTTGFTVSSDGEIRTVGLMQGPLILPFQVIATDMYGGSTPVQIQVSIPSCTLNSAPPLFSQTAYFIPVTCVDSPYTLIGSIMASYSQPENLVYTVTGTNEFIVNNLGDIRTLVPLSSGSSHVFNIAATDGKMTTQSATAQVTIDVRPCTSAVATLGLSVFTWPSADLISSTTATHFAPYFTNPSYSFTVVCNSPPGTAVGLVYAADDHSSVRYSTQSRSFSISQSGELRTTYMITSTEPISFIVTATDDQGLSGTATVSVTVTGCGAGSPSGLPLINLPQGKTITNCDTTTSIVRPGTEIGYVSAASASGQTGPGSGLHFALPFDRRFVIDQNTGQIFAAVNLDTGSYMFQIQVSDSRLPQMTATGTFTAISRVNIYENFACTVNCASVGYRPCNPSYLEATISEKAPVGTTVIVLSGEMPSSSSRPYTAPVSPSGYYAQQNAVLNSQYVKPPTTYYGNHPVSATALQPASPYAQPVYYAVESGGKRDYRTVQAASSPRNVSRERRQVYSNSLVSAASLPLMAGYGSNGNAATVWTIQKASVPGQFRLDPQTGRITVAESLDREKTGSYVLKVRNTVGNQNCVVKVGIDVLDDNDNAPVFTNQTYIFAAPCNTPSGLVGAVTARDADLGLRGFVKYSIPNAEDSPFEIDCFSGEIRTRRPVAPNELPQNLMVQATNPSIPSKTTTATVVIDPGIGCF